MKFTNGVLHRDVHFLRVVHDWELEALLSFMDTIYGTFLRGLGRIKCVGNQIGLRDFWLVLITIF